MPDALIGYTGFVGSNIAQQRPFDVYIHRANSHKMLETSYDQVYAAGISSLKHWANANPEQDKREIASYLETLTQMTAKQLIFISSVDVFGQREGQVETFSLDAPLKEAYGANRRWAEEVVRAAFPDALIVRLPSIFGHGIKKNLIRDLLIPYPAMLLKRSYETLCQAIGEENVSPSYQLDENNLYVFTQKENPILLEVLYEAGMDSLSFTDSRSTFQFYDLKHLLADCERALARGQKELNLLTPPLTGEEIAKEVFQKDWQHHLLSEPVYYNLTSAAYSTGYCQSREQVLRDVTEFVQRFQKEGEKVNDKELFRRKYSRYAGL